MTYVTTVDNMPAFLTTDRLRGFALRPLRIPHQGDRIRTYGSLKLLYRLFGRIFLKRIVTTDDLFDDSGQHNEKFHLLDSMFKNHILNHIILHNSF